MVGGIRHSDCFEWTFEADLNNSKRNNKFPLPGLAKAIYGSFDKTESEISNIVNYNSRSRREPYPLSMRHVFTDIGMYVRRGGHIR